MTEMRPSQNSMGSSLTAVTTETLPKRFNKSKIANKIILAELLRQLIQFGPSPDGYGIIPERSSVSRRASYLKPVYKSLYLPNILKQTMKVEIGPMTDMKLKSHGLYPRG